MIRLVRRHGYDVVNVATLHAAAWSVVDLIVSRFGLLRVKPKHCRECGCLGLNDE